jgi:hypothetical protein
MSDNPKPRVGYQPQRDSDHATQLLTDIEALRAYLGNKTTGRSKSLPRDLADQIFSSMEGFIKKGREQPTVKELQLSLEAAELANQTLRTDVILIKNNIQLIQDTLLNTTNNPTRPHTYAQATSKHLPHSQHPPLSLPKAPGIPKEHELIVKLHDSNPDLPIRRVTNEQIIDQVNEALIGGPTGDPATKYVRAVKRLPSGDITLYTANRAHTDYLIKHRERWEKVISNKAKAHIPTYGILAHGISTEINISDTHKLAEDIKWDNPCLAEATITYIGWLKRDLDGKRASTLVIEFAKPQHADEMIRNGMFLNRGVFACEYYDRTCKLKQCFKCQQYGHIAPHCKAMEACNYCAGQHNSQECEERNKCPKPAPKCAVCKGKHTAWSPICPDRRAALAKIETAKSLRPYTHQDTYTHLSTPIATHPTTRNTQQDEPRTTSIPLLPRRPQRSSQLTQKAREAKENTKTGSKRRRRGTYEGSFTPLPLAITTSQELNTAEDNTQSTPDTDMQ